MQFSSVLLSAFLFCTAATHASAESTSSSTISFDTNPKNNSATSHSIHANSESTTKKTEEEETDPFQLSLDTISHEWEQICSMGCQPGTWPGDSHYISNYVIPDLISIQYKPSCSAKKAHMKYLRDIFECSGRRDLCLELDKKTMKCRDAAMRKVTASLKHLGESAMDCEKDDKDGVQGGTWQEDFYEAVLGYMRFFREGLCRGVIKGEVRDCELMGTCMSTIEDF